MVLRRPVGVVVAAVLVFGCGSGSDSADKEMTSPIFPSEVAGFSADGEMTAYDTESIYAYINGHAEVYMAYGMRRCLSQRYLGPDNDTEIVVDLFEMASPADAYGVFSHDRSGEAVAVGQGGVFRHGWLSFWTGSGYGSVYASGGEGSFRDAVLEIGRAAADVLPAGGEIPALVDRLPADGLDPASVCFLRSPQILNAHVVVGSDNVFGLGPGVEAVVGKYDLGDSVFHLVLVEHPSAAAAESVEADARTPAEADSSRR